MLVDLLVDLLFGRGIRCFGGSAFGGVIFVGGCTCWWGCFCWGEGVLVGLRLGAECGLGYVRFGA